MDYWKQAQDWFSGLAGDYAKDPAKIKSLLEEAQEKAEQNQGPLQEVWEKLQALFRLLSAYFSGAYQDVPWQSILSAVLAVLYLVIPTDAIPDIIPVAGLVDDAAVLGIVIASLKADLDRFLNWERAMRPDSEPSAT